MSSTQISLGDVAPTTDSPTIFDGEAGRPFEEKEGREDAMEARIDELVSQLIEDAQEVRDSEVFKDWLDANSSFHDYSAKNSMLIQIQHPGAERVAGMKTWNDDFNRQVKEGETAIWIWKPDIITGHKCPQCGNAPAYHAGNADLDCEHAGEDSDPAEWDFQYTEEWERGEILCGFSPAPVYALEQTEGEPLPELPTEATGNADLLEPAHAAAEELGHSVEIVPTAEWNRRADGTCNTNVSPAEIRVEQDTPANTASVLIHETAHAELHREAGLDTQAKEVEAEAVAYIVSEHFGLNSSGSAFYLASWADDTEKEINTRLKRIKDTARTLIDEIEAQIDG